MKRSSSLRPKRKSPSPVSGAVTFKDGAFRDALGLAITLPPEEVTKVQAELRQRHGLSPQDVQRLRASRDPTSYLGRCWLLLAALGAFIAALGPSFGWWSGSTAWQAALAWPLMFPLIGPLSIALGAAYIALRPLASKQAAHERAALRSYEHDDHALHAERLAEYRQLEAAEMVQRLERATFWTALSGRDFELEMARLFSRSGYQATPTPATDDGGFDIVLTKDGTRTLVQCKAYKAQAGPAPVRELYGTLIAEKADAAILVCLGGFTDGAQAFAAGKPLRLMDLDDVLALARDAAP